MLGIHDQNQFIFKHRESFEVAIAWLRSHQGKVEIAFQDLAWQTVRHIAEDFDFDLGVLLAKYQNQFRQKIERRTLVRAYTNQSPLQALHLSDCLAHLVAQAKDSLR